MADDPSLDPSPDDSAPVPEPAGDPAGEPTAGHDPGDDLSLSLADLESQTGLDLSTYADPKAALKGLAEAKRMVGRRDEQAEMYRRIEEAVAGREQEFAAWLRGEAQKAASEPSPVPEEGPKSYAELQLLERQIYDEQGKVRPGTDEKLVRQYQQAQQKIFDTVLALQNDPQKVLGPMLDGLKQELLQTTQQTSAQQQAAMRQQQAWERLADEHAEMLFEENDRQRPTAFAQKAANEYQQWVQEGMPHSPATYQKVIRYLQAQAPKPQKTRTPNARSRHEPPVSAPDHEPPDAAKFFDEQAKKGSKQPLVDYLIATGAIKS